MVTLVIDNKTVCVPEGTSILDAARTASIDIPTLCYLKDLTNEGSCRMCVVEVKGARSLVASCVGTVSEGMEVFTNTPKVIASRKTTLELMLSNHNKDCLSCVRSTNCELQKLSLEYGCDDNDFAGEHSHVTVEALNPYLIRDNSKCILCRRCVAMCSKVQSVGVIGPNRRGFNTEIGCAFERNLGDVDCVACGQCAKVCPAGAAKLGQKLCTKEGPIVYPKQVLPDEAKWGPEMWNENYRDDNPSANCYDTGTAPCKSNCPAHIAVQGYIRMAT